MVITIIINKNDCGFLARLFLFELCHHRIKLPRLMCILDTPLSKT